MKKPAAKPAAKPAEDGQAALLDDPMQAYAMRVWDGQSVSLSRKERVARVHAALEGQGCTDFSAIELPGGDE
jgi:hypothetical protein